MSASRPPFPSPPSNPVLPLLLYKPSSICFLPPIDRVTSIERCPILMGQCKRQTYQWNWLDAMHQPRVESIVQWWIEWRWSGSERAQAKKIGTHTPRLAKYKDQYGGPRCNWAIHHHRYVQSGNGECAIAAAARTFVSHEIQSVRRGRFFFFLPKRDWRGPTAKMDECYFTIIVVWQRWTTPLFIYLTSRSSKYKMSSACVFQFLSERLSTRPECYFSIVEQTTRKRDEIIKYDDSPVGPSLYFSFPLSCKCCVSLFFLSVRENSPALTLCCWFWAGATTVRVGLCVIVGFSVLWLREGDGSAGGMSKEWGKIATGTHRQKKITLGERCHYMRGASQDGEDGSTSGGGSL